MHLVVYHLIYYALHENDKKISFFGDLFIIQVSYESISVRGGGLFFQLKI